MTDDRHLDLLELDAHRAGEPLAAGARAHLAWCSACRAALTDLQALPEQLTAQPPIAVPPERDEAILAVARARAAMARRDGQARPRLVPILRWAVAALLVLAVGTLALRQGSQIPPSQQAAAPGAGSALTAAQADLNGDGRVDVLDAFVLAKAVTRGTPRVGDADRHDVDVILAMAVSLDGIEEEP